MAIDNSRSYLRYLTRPIYFLCATQLERARCSLRVTCRRIRGSRKKEEEQEEEEEVEEGNKEEPLCEARLYEARNASRQIDTAMIISGADPRLPIYISITRGTMPRVSDEETKFHRAKEAT